MPNLCRQGFAPALQHLTELVDQAVPTAHALLQLRNQPTPPVQPSDLPTTSAAAVASAQQPANGPPAADAALPEPATAESSPMQTSAGACRPAAAQPQPGQTADVTMDDCKADQDAGAQLAADNTAQGTCLRANTTSTSVC